jgi:hypothetical protein
MSEKKKHRIHSQAISAIPSFSTFAKFQKDQVRSAKEAKNKNNPNVHSIFKSKPSTTTMNFRGASRQRDSGTCEYHV